MTDTLGSRSRPLMRFARASLFFGAMHVAFCASPSIARALPPPGAKAQVGGAADVLFDEGVDLADAGKLEEACQKFEASERLEHASGTLLNLADCYEKTNRLASAWEAFNQVAVEAKQAGKTARAEEARRRADALKPRLSKLVINLEPAVAALRGLVVKRSGALVESPLWGQSVPVDAGEQVITVSAPGKAPWRRTIIVREADAASVSVDALEDAKMPGQRIGALAAGGVGVAGIIVGSVVGGLAISSWHVAVEACNGSSGSPTACPTSGQRDSASALGSQAKGMATISTAGFVVGGVGLAAAGVLWFTTPREEAPPASAAWQVLPMVGPGGFGGILQRTF